MNDTLKTDRGNIRELNEDYITISVNENGDKLYILCDGMGGHNGGEVASKECAKYIKNKFKNVFFENPDEAKKWLYKIIISANKKIKKLGDSKIELSKMGTTLVCLMITNNFKVFASVGDSRIYSYSKKELKQLSEDQTFANALLKAGYINEKEAMIHPKKNILLSAIGTGVDDLDVQIKEVFDENYMICSDGLYNLVEQKEILKILSSELNLESKADILIKTANENGGNDNISIIIVEGNL